MSEDAIRRRSFPEAFKREAVAAIRGGRSVSQVAAELGLPDRLVRSWLGWADEHPAAASGAPAPSRAQAAARHRVGPSPHHIEQSSTPFLEFPIGSIYQPNEHGLELTRAHLLELNQELVKLKGKPARVALRDLTIYPSTPGTPEMRQTLIETQKRQRATQYAQPPPER